MSFKSLDLKPVYISLEDDVDSEFYVPVLSNAVRYDRVSCFFSYKILARYCTGLYYLSRNEGKYRLLISQNISEDDFNAIKAGLEGRALLEEDAKRKMREALSLDDAVTLSNLAYLIECGLVDVKFAYCHNGLFHEKTGYAEDSEGNAICFTGSNNETLESIDKNYEKFEVTTTWLSSEFDQKKIWKSKHEFESMWEGKNEHVLVFDPPESFDKFIQSFNRGALQDDPRSILEEAFYFDCVDGTMVLSIPTSIKDSSYYYKFTLKIGSLVEYNDGHKLVIKSSISNSQISKVIEKVNRNADEYGFQVFKSPNFTTYLESRMYMERLALTGLSIKRRDSEQEAGFRAFKHEVDSVTSCPLRDEQMWDSYFAFKLGRSANFSVPGSGKTATALGMFAYLSKVRGVRRLFVIGPLNCFDSWKSEFSRVFGDKLPLKAITSIELKGMGGRIESHIRYDIGKYNLVLLNYESFEHNNELTRAVQGIIDERTMLVFDEVHRIKAIDGKRASGVIPISKNSRYTIVMTGTPIPNNYSDVYNFLHILYGDEYDRYFEKNDEELAELKGDEASDFNRKLKPFFCRTTKKNLGVPEPEPDNEISVRASPEEEELFERLHQMRLNPLTIVVRVLQLESNPIMLNSALSSDEMASFRNDPRDSKKLSIQKFEGVNDMLTSKTKKCVELVKQLTSEGKNVIVWCIFVDSINHLSVLLNREGIHTCTVFGNTENRGSVIDDFKTGRYNVLITNPQTLAESVSLHKNCHDAVYFEYSYNLVHMLQSKDRINRLGLEPNQYTQYHFLETIFETEGKVVSLDKEIYSRLNHKEMVMLQAIEDDSLEHFTTTQEELEDILESIGFDREQFTNSKS